MSLKNLIVIILPKKVSVTSPTSVSITTPVPYRLSDIQTPNMTSSPNQTHSSNKIYKCNICNKSYCRKWTLKQHMMIHTGERPFSCKVSLFFFYISKIFFPIL